MINYDAKQIREKLGRKTKADIYETSGMVLQKLESGARMLIDCYFKRAVLKARGKFPGLVIAPEFPLKSTDLGVEGFEDVGGRVDYATAIGPYGENTADKVRGLIYTSYPEEDTVCCVCEAKHRGTIDATTSRAEAIGALLVLAKNKEKKRPINGVLADGRTRSFLRLNNGFLYLTEEISAVTEEAQEVVLGLLTRWIVGAEIEDMTAFTIK